MAYGSDYTRHLAVARENAKAGQLKDVILHYFIAAELGDHDYCILCIDILEGRKTHWFPQVVDWS